MASSSSKSWNLQSKLEKDEDLRFVVPKRLRGLRDKVLAFVEGPVYKLEDKLRQRAKQTSGSSTSLLEDAELAAALVRLQGEAKKQGLWALGHPKEIGGGGMPFRDYLYVCEVSGRSELASVALGAHSLQDCLMLHNHASEAVKEQYLAPLVAGEVFPSFAMTEPDIVSSDPTGIQTEAKLQDGHWVINGRKWWCTGASLAAFTSVMVRTETGDDTVPHTAFSIVLVPKGTPGFSIVRATHVLGTDSIDHSELVFDNVRVPEENLIGPRGLGFMVAMERLGPGRVFHCMRWIGQMQRAFDLMCTRLAQRRVQGGRKRLGDMQLMQKHVFDSYVDINSHRLLTLAAAEAMDGGRYARIELAAAKAFGAGALCRVMDRAVQVWGAKGLSSDTPLSDMYRHARAARFYDGPDEVHFATLGRLMVRGYSSGKAWEFSEGRFKRVAKL